MQPLKAPSVDGIHVMFYQKIWEVVGSSAWRFVKDVLSGKELDG